MPTLEERVAKVEFDMKRALATVGALQGQPTDATLSIPHNDSWLFEDNVDSTHAGNLRYVISSNVQRVVSAKLSIHLAPYRTYNNVTGVSSGTESATHNHTLPIAGNAISTNKFLGFDTGDLFAESDVTGGTVSLAHNSTPSNNESATHAHLLNITAILGVTEGATAAGVTIAFDGVDQTTALGGPFSADAIELNVLPYLPLTKGLFHAIAMTPSGLGRIEAHLRLGVYVAAGSVF